MERKANAPKRAVAYARIASVKVGKCGKACGEQLRRTSEYAVSTGYDVAATFFDEGVSAGDLERPGLRAMLTYLRDHSDHEYAVVIDNASRLSRDFASHQKLTTEIAQTGARLIVAGNRGGVQ